MVDPQLKNNPDLVECLVEFEDSWEKGNQYFISPLACSQLIHFSEIIEATAEKYDQLEEQIENREAEVFLSIPCLLVLKCLDGDDKGLCQQFYPAMFDEAGHSPAALKFR